MHDQEPTPKPPPGVRLAAACLLVAGALTGCCSGGDRIDSGAVLERNLTHVSRAENQRDANLVVSISNQSHELRLLDIFVEVDENLVLSATADSLGYDREAEAEVKLAPGEHHITLTSLNFPQEVHQITVTMSGNAKQYLKMNFICESGMRFADDKAWSVVFDEDERAHF